MNEAFELKEKGNSQFSKGDYQGALLHYKSAIGIASLDSNKENIAEANKLLSTLYLNSAICSINTDKLNEGDELLNKALGIDSSYIKALYWKAKLLFKKG